MAKYDLAITRHIGLNEEDIEDLMVTALEGGIGYWAVLDNTGERWENAPVDEPVSITAAKILMENGCVRFEDAEGEDESWVLTISKLMDGIHKYVERGMDEYNVFSGNRPDMCNCDAEVADAIIQLALFGDIVFG